MTLLEIQGLCKSYHVPVLRDFDFTLKSGEVHALVGSNGAGKSTAARILCGMTPFDSGAIRLGGESYVPRSKHAADAAGVIMVMQELNILSTLSVAENLFLDRLPHSWGVIDRRELRARAKQALETVRLGDIDPDQPAGTLGVGKQQLVEIASALARECRVLILDEPTAALTDTETENLFARMRELRQAGVGIIYISHRMDEIRRIADRVTVLRDGRRIGTRRIEEVDMDAVITDMAGRELALRHRERPDLADAPMALEVAGMAAPPAVCDTSFSVRQGEILGVAGLVGSGRTELLRLIFGADAKARGHVRVDGVERVIHSPGDAVAAGIGMVPEDRKVDSLLLARTVRSNATLSTHDLYSRFGLMDLAAETAAIESGCRELDVKLDALDQAVAELSGGNQQKIVMLRWLLRDSIVLLLDEPTRGVDIATKGTIYGLLDAFAAKGKAIVFISSELQELMANCDRIVVMSAGRLVAEFLPDNWSQQDITRAAFSGYLDRAV